jgi:hypothetical protein
MTKLYELLPVESDLRKESAEELKRVVALFAAPGQLIGQNISYHKLMESEPDLSSEASEMATTVESELEDLWKVFGGFLDVTIQKENANVSTQADVMVDGQKFLEGLTAPALLNLEGRLEELRKAYEAVPTLDPSEHWNWDSNLNCFVSDVRGQFRTKKLLRNHVLAEATKEHPAQVQVYQEDVPSYKIEKQIFSGMFTMSEKNERLERLKKLQSAVKQARQRANDIEIRPEKLSGKIADYINTGKL